MKPWERNLEVDERGGVWEVGKPAAWRHQMPEGHSCTKEEVLEYGTMFAAAPDMARALLLLLGENGHFPWCHAWFGGGGACIEPCTGTRAALSKAGVPLP